MSNSSSTIYLDPKSPCVRDLATLAFPEYTGKKFKIRVITGPIQLNNYFSGNKRDNL